MGSIAKSYMRKGFLIYEEMRKYLTIYKTAVSHILCCNPSILNFLIYECAAEAIFCCPTENSHHLKS